MPNANKYLVVLAFVTRLGGFFIELVANEEGPQLILSDDHCPWSFAISKD